MVYSIFVAEARASGLLAQPRNSTIAGTFFKAILGRRDIMQSLSVARAGKPDVASLLASSPQSVNLEAHDGQPALMWQRFALPVICTPFTDDGPLCAFLRRVCNSAVGTRVIAIHAHKHVQGLNSFISESIFWALCRRLQIRFIFLLPVSL